MKIRILSDLHVDYNDRYNLKYDDDIFTIICGDTAQTPKNGIEWIKNNIKNGLVICGNHMPYGNFGSAYGLRRTMQELRNEYAEAFPIDSNISYLDSECGVISKVIDNILFVGTVMYTDMQIKHNIFNPTGDIKFNCRASEYHMNDFRCGLISIDRDAIEDDIFGSYSKHSVKMTAGDYVTWFEKSKRMIDDVLNKNEQLEHPLPVVLFTHHSLIKDLLHYSYYIGCSYSMREYNWSSYASDYEDWLLSHKSIKAYCCGHIHAIDKNKRVFEIGNDEHKILVINNARGYVYYGHDEYFNKNLILDSDTWTVQN